MRKRHAESHVTHRLSWLRPAVLGANDGIISTASLILGVAAAQANSQGILAAGVAGLVAGSMSMAAGEYVSVYSQRDSENAEQERERHEIQHNREGEHKELAAIYVGRGLEPALAHQVADQLMAHDALGAHMRDELGMSDISLSRPLRAAGASALSFAVGAALPLIVLLLVPMAWLLPMVFVTALVFLACLGALASVTGGASAAIGALRVVVLGALAMLVTIGVGRLFDLVI